jgi:hypothetical protein
MGTPNTVKTQYCLEMRENWNVFRAIPLELGLRKYYHELTQVAIGM